MREKLRRANLRYWPRRLFLPPEWLVLGVNNACNLHCKMCDVGTGRDDSNFARNLIGTQPRDMPLELFERIAAQAAAHYPRVRLGFAFTEPLMWPHLVPALRLARERRLFTELTTNGLLLERLAETLAEAGLDDACLSLDGPADVHDRIRGRQGSFERARRGLERLLACRPRPQVGVFCVVTAWNQRRLREFAESFADLPLRALGFMHTNFTTAAMAETHNARWGRDFPATVSNVDEFDPLAVDSAALAAEVERVRALRLPFPVSFSPELRSADAVARFYRRHAEFIGRGCADAARALLIKSDGSVIPAHGRCYDVSIGNLWRQALPEIWNSAGAARLRVTLQRAGGLLPACARCCSAY